MTARIRRNPLAAAVVTLSLLALGGCSSGEDPASSEDAKTTPASATRVATESPAGPASEPSSAAGDTDAVPGACGLIAADQLSGLVGVDVGVGEEESVSPQRSVCFYSAGVITAVEVAAHYEASRSLIEEMGSTTEDIPDVGLGAFYDANGQVIILGERYFVAVTAYPPDRGRLTEAAKVLLATAEG
ncbi:MAG: hypothetical protein ABWZ26_03255 [Candidatus Nanopelagicales bacterium]